MTNKPIYRLIIDQGTSATKLLLVDTSVNVQIIDRLDRKHQQIYPQQGWVEHDPLEIIDHIRELIDTMLKKHQLIPTMIETLSITNQRETIVAWDKRDGLPIMNALVWQCKRSEAIAQAMDTLTVCQQLKKTGLKMDTYFSGPKIKWLMSHHPTAQTLLNEGHLAIGTMDAWIIYQLTGRIAFVSEASNASRTLLYDIYQGQWDDELCELFGIHRQALPKILPANALFGTYLGIEIRGVLADSQAAYLAHQTQTGKKLKATLGTGCSILSEVKGIKHDKDCLLTIAVQKNDEVMYVQEGIIRSFGDCLNWFEFDLGLIQNLENDVEMAMFSPRNGEVFIPSPLGLAAPFWSHHTRASLHYLSRNTTRLTMLRAVIEGMVFQLKAVIDRFQTTSEGYTTLLVDGGISKNHRIVQLIADVLNCKVAISPDEEMSALGCLSVLDDVVLGEIDYVTLTPQNSEGMIDPYHQWVRMVVDAIQQEDSPC